ncbi:MAG: hypothetical protein I3273_02890 [Candidatus Moeniiplasma glomeromycotorum]|nr:hypothetical protein [Candidatus Moeniiplasma glomeromycotorum]MCE8167598.1 hypothetical protein [Candidatus Moeniiplasma glomeromycotorum]MCE8169052.1 hypothetical protein [Candidatus Moeniiplasma glomeromycotorum]
MTYTAQSIEEIFTRKAWVCTSKKIQGDGGYWAGGRCEYGGAHNLKEDCQTLAKFFWWYHRTKKCSKRFSKL